MAGFYFDFRKRFPWREQLRLYRWIALGIGTYFAWSQIPAVLGLAARAPSLTPLVFARDLAVSICVVLLPALVVPTLGLLVTIALWPWGQKYLGRKPPAASADARVERR
jgi:hypothetical protein